MADRPILFSAPMVRALLAGTKTQTRRVIKPRGRAPSLFDGTWSDSYVLDPGNQSWRDRDVPVKPGDRLWCRESWRAPMGFDRVTPRDIPSTAVVVYEASGDGITLGGKLRPGIHMPRWASRLTLNVADVRVQRLKDISEEDALAEGVEHDTDGWRDYLMPATQCCGSARESYRTLWDAINGENAWDANPWIVAYSFSVHQQNIDALEEHKALAEGEVG